MSTRDHQAVPLAHGMGIGDAERQLVLQQHPPAALQRAEHTARFAVVVAGLHTAEAERLQVAHGVGAALVFGDDVVHLQGPLVFVGAAGLAAAPGPCEHPVLHRAADRAAVAAAVGKHFLAALLAEGVEALAAQLLQRVALGVAQFVAADQAVGAVAVGVDAVEGEPCPPSAAQDPPGHGLRWGRAAPPQQLHEHEGLVDGAHAHALGDERAQAKEGSGRAGGHGVMVAAAGRPGQVWLWAARKAIAPAGIPSCCAAPVA